jgi:hypothetical protein
MTEQEATDKLEELVGDPAKCFYLMRLYQSCSRITRPGITFLRDYRDTAKLFREGALAEGYSAEAVEHYLQHIV